MLVSCPKAGTACTKRGTDILVNFLRVPQFCVNEAQQVEKQLNIQEVKRLIGEIQQLVDEQETDLPTLTGLADELWDYTDLMRYFRISLSTVKRRRRDKTFKGFPIGSRFYYLKSEILKIPKALMSKR